jgi:hypothetical protein
MSTELNIGLIGANGFVGKKFSAILAQENIAHENVIRENYGKFKESNSFSHVINCAMPSGRFWSKNNPNEDFSETILKTFNIKKDFFKSRIIQISSISARVQLDTVYGRNKRAAELILDPQKDLIIRLGPIYDFSMEKGALIDIVKGSKVFVSGDTKYAFTPLEWAGLEILNMKDETGMFEVGSRNYVVLKELRDILNSSSKFEGPLDDQVFPNAGEGCPDANDVIDFARGLMA